MVKPSETWLHPSFVSYYLTRLETDHAPNVAYVIQKTSSLYASETRDVMVEPSETWLHPSFLTIYLARHETELASNLANVLKYVIPNQFPNSACNGRHQTKIGFLFIRDRYGAWVTMYAHEYRTAITLNTFAYIFSHTYI